METGSDPGNDGPYWLAAHVYFGLCARHAVLMDLQHDRYHAVQPAEALAGWVHGWPLPGERTAPAPPIVRRLLAQGLLVRDARRGRMAVAVSAREPTRTLLEFDFANRPTAGARAAADLARAWAAARLWLALFSMQTVLGRVGARGAARGACRGAWDWDRAHELVMRFVHLRPLFYTAREACLLDSLTLLNFLALHDVYPQWVFGVRTAPFHAHCWVQQEDVLYNDMPERVRQYTPILRI
ncbi:MAG: lasso peptide biosynthesis B2 protein [Steroidobacteraceae bacterium]